MKFCHEIIFGYLLTTATISAHAQTTPPLSSLKAVLDTVAVTGTTRVLALAAAPGPDIPVRVLTPGMKVAVFYALPSREHEYDLQTIRLLVSERGNFSRTGQLLIDLLLPDSITHGPSARRLLPTPLLVTDREVRRAKGGILTLDVSAYHLTMPSTGIFVVAQGIASPPFRYLGDTLIQEKKSQSDRSVYIKINTGEHSNQLRLVNATDFICIRDIRTTAQPQTWDFSSRKGAWIQRKSFYSTCPKCIISNSGLELVVREL